MNNIAHVLVTDLKRHRAPVVLPGDTQERQDLFLIEINAQASLPTCFTATYGSMNATIAIKAFGEDDKRVLFGVFVTESGEVAYAFCRGFADYNRESKRIIFKDPENVILEYVREKTMPRYSEQWINSGLGMGMSVNLRYSLPTPT